jgi:hypothetical protein
MFFFFLVSQSSSFMHLHACAVDFLIYWRYIIFMLFFFFFSSLAGMLANPTHPPQLGRHHLLLGFL